MFWSKKPKAEKIREQGGAKPAGKKPARVAKPAKAAPSAVAKAVVSVPTGSFAGSSSAILRPRITEKSGLLSQGGVYTFEVTKNSNREAIAKAVMSLYKVTPERIAIINLPAKNVFVRGKRGRVAGVRKAMVTLKKGDKIDFV